MDLKTVGPWAVRMLLLALGGWLTRAFAVGDDQLWGNIADSLAGPLVVAGTAVWSWRATKVQAQAPAIAAATATAAAQAVSDAVPSADQIANMVASKIIDTLDRKVG